VQWFRVDAMGRAERLDAAALGGRCEEVGGEGGVEGVEASLRPDERCAGYTLKVEPPPPPPPSY
jgi:hypothetical protein